MKKQALVTLAVIIVLIPFYVNVSNASPQIVITLKSSGFVQQTSTSTSPGVYSYIISVSGLNYQMTDGTTGQVMFQSTNSSQVFSNVVGNCSAGSSIDVENGLYVVNTMWTMLNVDNVTLNFEAGAELVAGDGLDTSVLMIGEPYYPSNNITVIGVTIDGNAANQVITYSNSWNEGAVIQYPNGITMAGSNDEIVNANIYDCRVMGIAIAWTGADGWYASETNNGVISSQIRDCGWNGVIFYGSPECTNCYLTNSIIWACSDGGVSVSGGIDTLVSGNYVYDMNGTTGSENSEVAIAIEGGESSVIANNTIYNACIGISNSGWPNNIIENNTISVSPSYYVSYGSGGSWEPDNPVVLHETWGIVSSGNNDLISYNTISGMLTNATSGYYNPGGDGIWLMGETSSHISGNIISQCQNYAVYANSGDGVSINNVLVENTLINNANEIYDNNVPENTLEGNTGYNPVGAITHMVKGNYICDGLTVGVYGSSVWISGMVYTNGGSPKKLDITGGVVSSVTRNGVLLFTATNCIVTLLPGDTFSVTFSATPTINVNGQ
jgi:hypothetical protein